MHQMSPGVERAVAGARAWAARLDADSVRLSHLALALLDEDEGRPAVLVERAGLSVSDVRERLTSMADAAGAPPEPALFAAARTWSIAHRHDPEFLTDAFLLAVLRADPAFEAAAVGFGLDAGRLEGLLVGRAEPGPAGELTGSPGSQHTPDHDDLLPPPHPVLGSAEHRPPPQGGRSEAFTSPLEGEVGARRGSGGDKPPVTLRRAPGGGYDHESAGTNRTPAPQSTVEPEPPVAFALSDTAAEMDAARVLDANFNRAREAARVLEDYCRFALDDRFLTEQVKELRHGLVAAAGRLPSHLLLAARDTLRDVGTGVSAAGEYDRTTPAQVAAVNLKRLQESLRSLEEFGKLFGPELGRELEALRYRAYTLERAVIGGGRTQERLAGVKLYVLLSGADCTGALDWTIEQAAAGGAGVIQLREKTLNDRELVARARDVRRWTRKAGVLFVVNDRPDVARLAEADGVHLGQDDMAVKDARRVVGPDVLIGVSTHTIGQVRRAVLDGADYIGVGPVFPSKTKPFDLFPGPEFVRAAIAETSLPAFALGGIHPGNLGEVVAAGAKRVAVGSAVAAADDPERVARLLCAGLGVPG